MRLGLVVVFGVALVSRVLVQVGVGAYVQPRTWEYEVIASNILAGQGYTYASLGTTYVASVSSPLYVLLTAGVYAVTGHSAAAMLLLQAVFGATTAVLSAWLAGRIFASPLAAWAAGMLVAFDPGLLVYSAELHPLSLDALAFVAVICAAVALGPRPGWGGLALLGGLLGLFALTRSTALALIVPLLVWLRRFRGVRLVSHAAAALVIAAVVVYSPWPTRNSVLLGQLTPGSSEATEWMWRGTNPNATGSSLTADGRTMLEAAPSDFQTRVTSASEAERATIYRDAVAEFVRDQPAQAAGLYLVKLKAFWWASDSTGLLYPPAWVLGYQVWYLACLTLAAWGVWYARRERDAWPGVLLILWALLIVSLSQAVFYVEGRHRLAVEPLLLVLSAPGLAQLASRLRLPLATSRPALGKAKSGQARPL